MLKFLTVSRRVFLAGTASLIAIIVLFLAKHPGLSISRVFGNGYMFFALCSPILLTLFGLVSATYIRRKGQSAAIQQQLSFGKTLGQMFVADVTSPFRVIKEQFASTKNLVSYYGAAGVGEEVAKLLARGSRALNREKLYFLTIRVIIYVIGVLCAVTVLRG